MPDVCSCQYSRRPGSRTRSSQEVLSPPSASKFQFRAGTCYHLRIRSQVFPSFLPSFFLRFLNPRQPATKVSIFLAPGVFSHSQFPRSSLPMCRYYTEPLCITSLNCNLLSDDNPGLYLPSRSRPRTMLAKRGDTPPVFCIHRC